MKQVIREIGLLVLLSFTLLASATLPHPALARGPASGDQPPGWQSGPARSGAQLTFIANAGQFDRQVRFQVRGSQGSTVWLAVDAVWITLVEPMPARSPAGIDRPLPSRSASLRLGFEGSNPAPEVVGSDRLAAVANYYIGNDPAGWRSNVPTYGAVTYRGLYPGIDLVYRGEGGYLKSAFLVAPGADPARIRLVYDGVQGMHLDSDGALILETGLGDLVEEAPLIYQEAGAGRQEIPGRYLLLGDKRVGFEIGAYDPGLPLVIDPVLYWSTYLGGNGNDEGASVAIDGSGNLYVTGFTNSSNFPGAGTSLAGTSDAFVVKYDSSRALVYATYLGGSTGPLGLGWDWGEAIAADGAGNAYVVGDTGSWDLPTANPLQSALGGTQDAFAAKLGPSGALLYSTYLGGSASDAGRGVAVDDLGSMYVTGYTQGSGFPVSTGALQTTYGGSNNYFAYGDAFITKLNPASAGGPGSLVYSTYLGGSGDEIGYGIAVDGAGQAYVTGLTMSANFYTTSTTYSDELDGPFDAFLTKISANGSASSYSTYLGGNGTEIGYGVALGAAGIAYVTGGTDSSQDFPLSGLPYDGSHGGLQDAFLLSIDTASSEEGSLLYGTYLGSAGDDVAYAVATHPWAGNAVCLTGATGSADLFEDSDLEAYAGGTDDVLVACFDPTESADDSLLYGGYLGGSGQDVGLGIAISDSYSYITGWTYSANFPLKNPLQGSRGDDGSYKEAFVSQIAHHEADLQVVVADTPDPVAPGGDLRYEMSIVNNGPDESGSITLRSTLPPGVTFVDVSPSPPCGLSESNSVYCHWVASLASGDTMTVTIDVKAPSTRGTITNTVNVTALAHDPDLADNTHTITTTVGGADLVVEKTDSVDPVLPGGDLQYTISIQNLGPETAVSPRVTDTLPDSVTFVSVNPWPACNWLPPNQVYCDQLANLEVGQTVEVIVDVKAPSQTGVTITNTVSVSALEPDEVDPSDNEDVEYTHVGGADLRVSMVDDPDPVAVNGELSYEIGVMNNGPEAAPSVRFTDTLPAEVTFVGVNALPGDPTPPVCAHAGRLVTCDLGTLVAGEYRHFSVKVTAPSEEGLITNMATVSSTKQDPNRQNNTASEQTTVRPGADMFIIQRDMRDPVATGGDLVYGITVWNFGPEPASNVTVTDTLPAGVTFVSTVPPCSHSAGIVVCSLGSMPAGDMKEIAVLLKAPTQAGTISNRVQVSASEPDPITMSNSATEETTVKPGTDLALTNSDHPDPVATGGNLSYGLVVWNNGPEVATNVRLTDTLPAGVTFVGLEGPYAADCTHGPVMVFCSFGSLNPSDSKGVTIRLTAPTQAGTITNEAEVWAKEPDTVFANNMANQETTVVPGADLLVVKSDSLDPVAQGSEFEYTIRITNLGPESASGVTVTDTLPAEVAFMSATPAPVGGPTPLVWHLGTLPSGASTDIVIRVRAPDEDANVTNCVQTRAQEPDGSTANNTFCEYTTVVPGARLSIAMTDSPDPVAMGAPLDYVIEVTNLGPDSAQNVTVQDTLPAAAAFVSASPTPATLNPLSWSLGTMAKYESRTITVRVTAPLQPGTITNQASVQSTTPDPDLSDNTASQTTSVEVGSDQDNDGVADSSENGAPNSGDGNADGTLDSQQDNVASLPNEAGEYVTLVSPGGTQLEEVTSESNPAPGSAPPTTHYPLGFYHFRVTGIAPGSAVDVTMIVHPTATLNAYWKYGPEPGNPVPHWYRFSYDGTTGAEIVDAHTIIVHFVDGLRGDHDLMANGEILDPGAPVEQTFQVNSWGDGGDANPGDGYALDEHGDTTLRAAIEEANASTGMDTILFNLPVFGVPLVPTAPLPAILEAVRIDGSSQPGYAGSPVVELDGSQAGTGADGLVITGGGSTVYALSIYGFDGNGIRLTGGGGNRIQASYLGTTRLGTPPAWSNRQYGLSIEGSANNLIGGNHVERNQISGNHSGGVRIAGSGASGNVLQGNRVGTNPSGSQVVGNSGDGILIEDAPDNTVGGTESLMRNLIGGNAHGVVISGTLATGNQVLGNYIGIDYVGNVALPNWSDGVLIQNAPGNTIGGTASLARNIIASSSGGYGLHIRGAAATGNQVWGNYIGTASYGDLDLGNSSGGVLIENAPANLIGGASAGAGNLISANGPQPSSSMPGVILRGAAATGNQVVGNRIGTDAGGTYDLGNSGDGLFLDGAPGNLVAGNLISGNDGDGIEISGAGASGNQVVGNSIGTNLTGTGLLPNQTWWNAQIMDSGVRINAAPGNTLGGTTAAERNLIGGGDIGVRIEAEAATGNVVQGNFIGTNANGTGQLANAIGIEILAAPENTIGGTAGTTPGGACSGACNLISGNSSSGIRLDSCSGTVVQGNFVGVDVNGVAKLPNYHAVNISYAADNIIGGTTSAARNLISGNYGSAVYVDGPSSTGNLIQGNFLGTDTTGTSALGNNYGVWIWDASNTTIAGNLISGNSWAGVRILGKNTSAFETTTLVQGNRIGTDASGTSALGNLQAGVEIWATGNTIGGHAPGAGNLIAFNGRAGVSVVGGTRNAVAANRIVANGGLGIDLGDDGATANDSGDGDEGANHLQNYPVLTSVTTGSSGTMVSGVLNSTANTTFRVEFFSGATCDPSGYGEGETYLGSTTVTTDGHGGASLVATFATAIPAGDQLSVTATDANGNTSEFSACASAVPTSVWVASFTAQPSGEAILITWQTASEVDTEGFHLYRSENGAPGSYARLNTELIPSKVTGGPGGADYEWTDAGVLPGQVYYYLLEAVDIHGGTTQFGPVLGSLLGQADHRIYLPLILNTP